MFIFIIYCFILRKKQLIPILLFLLIGCNQLYSQTSSETAVNKTKLDDGGEKTKELDTEESIKHIGTNLWFQVRKRLHLTSEEEEKNKETEKKSKKVVYNIAGIKFERD